MLESKRRAIIFFVIAILLAALSGYFILDKVKEINNELGTMVKVYVADRPIYSRAIISLDDVTTTEIPQKFLREEFITEEEAFRNHVSVVPLQEGQIITKNMLKQATAVTEEDNRLITVVESGNVYFDEPLDALDRVDIIISHQVDGDQVTEVFMEDVKVARVTTGELIGVQLEVSFDEVTDLIHMQHYADVFRVIRANVGQMPSNTTSPTESEGEDDVPTEQENVEIDEDTTEQE